MSPQVVTFDAGQTLIELDLDFLSTRLAGRGLTVDVAMLGDALPAAWAVYDRDVAAGVGHPWRALMTALLVGAGVADARATETAEWLWTQQPSANLFRKPIIGMVALARELAARGVRVAVLSNSEGRLAELLTEIGIADAFEVIVDSGRLGIDKPDRRIFEHTLAALGLAAAEVDGAPVHIGDSWAADVVGALGVDWRAIWYGPRVGHAGDPRVTIARDAAETRAALVAYGVL